MKGVVFNVFNQLVEEKFGLPTWDKILTTVNPESEGVYTAGGSYDDKELFSLVGELSKHSGVAVEQLVRGFGQYMFRQLATLYPVFFQPGMTLKEFLLSVDSVIHVEVRKLYPGASLPEFTYEDLGKDRLLMKYRSKKKLCVLAEGLIKGASLYFETPIEQIQTKCMHKGDDHCCFDIQFKL